MFIGHFALGYAARPWASGLSLAALFAAAQFADLLWPILVAVGIEQVRIAPGFTASTPLEFLSYPYSHSLVALAVWGALFGWVCARSAAVPAAARTRVMLLVAALVVSHWVLDVVTHVPDMPVYPGGPELGLGLWHSVPGTLAVETLMFAGGVWIYASKTQATDAVGKWAFIGVTAFLFVGFVANALARNTPPPSVTALWSAALVLGGLTLVLAWWADAHRTVRRGRPDRAAAARTLRP